MDERPYLTIILNSLLKFIQYILFVIKYTFLATNGLMEGGEFCVETLQKCKQKKFFINLLASIIIWALLTRLQGLLWSSYGVNRWPGEDLNVEIEYSYLKMCEFLTTASTFIVYFYCTL